MIASGKNALCMLRIDEWRHVLKVVIAKVYLIWHVRWWQLPNDNHGWISINFSLGGIHNPPQEVLLLATIWHLSYHEMLVLHHHLQINSPLLPLVLISPLYISPLNILKRCLQLIRYFQRYHKCFSVICIVAISS